MKAEKFYFTFGSGQTHFGMYVCIFGTYEKTKEQMFRDFGQKWSMQYSEKEFKGQPKKWNLKELK